MSSQYTLAFWNLENLFDIENYPHRSDKLQRAIGSDLVGWDQPLLDRKIFQLASIIQQINNGSGPDILGVCEVENEHVMQLLVTALAPLGRNYNVEHHDTSDHRGIDVGFIYDADLFSVNAQFFHVVMRRTATRDILQVNFQTSNNRLFVILGNHWPARSGGELETRGYRWIAGETLAYFHQRILECHGADTPILAMGDFNDEPFDRSLMDYALAIRSKMKVVKGRRPYFFNLMWQRMGERIASFYYDNFPYIYDQFLANKNMIKGSSQIKVLPETVEILRYPEMVASGNYPTPVRFGGMGTTVNQNGFSDHFPVAIKVEETD
jgi:hypothetical protein